MADYAIPKFGVAYVVYTGLVSQADTKLLKSAPTLAAGDFKVSIDGGAFANLATLPTNTPGGTSVKISLSAGEMTGDNILVACIDAAGAEWCDQMISIQTSPVGLNNLATPTNITAVGSVTAAITLPTIPTNWITADGIAANAIGASELATDAVAEIQSGLSTLDAFTVRDALGLASANLDTQLADLPTNADLATALGTADDATLAAIAAVSTKIDTVDDLIDTEVAAIKVVTDKLGTTVVLDGAVYQFTANALELAPSSGGGSTVQINPVVIQRTTPDMNTGLFAYVGEEVDRGYLFYEVSATGIRTAYDFSPFTHLRLVFETIADAQTETNVDDVYLVETADITVSANLLTFHHGGDLTMEVRTLAWTLWDWVDTTNRQVVFSGEIVISSLATPDT